MSEEGLVVSQALADVGSAARQTTTCLWVVAGRNIVGCVSVCSARAVWSFHVLRSTKCVCACATVTVKTKRLHGSSLMRRVCV